jgi:hypothetical protein
VTSRGVERQAAAYMVVETMVLLELVLLPKSSIDILLVLNL